MAREARRLFGERFAGLSFAAEVVVVHVVPEEAGADPAGPAQLRALRSLDPGVTVEKAAFGEEELARTRDEIVAEAPALRVDHGIVVVQVGIDPAVNRVRVRVDEADDGKRTMMAERFGGGVIVEHAQGPSPSPNPPPLGRVS